jgi:hypothetical protein
MGWYGLDCPASRQEPVEAGCEYGKETSDSIKLWEILE